MAKPKSKPKPRASKRDAWLKHYLNESNPETFMNKAASARAAGYRSDNIDTLSQIGCQNFSKLKDKVNRWLDENGLSEEALKTKLLSLLNAKDTKFFQNNGVVTDERTVNDNTTQRQALEMALKMRGMFEKDNTQRQPKIVIRPPLVDKPKESGK